VPPVILGATVAVSRCRSGVDVSGALRASLHCP
jgi:hypothetical protein